MSGVTNIILLQYVQSCRNVPEQISGEPAALPYLSNSVRHCSFLCLILNINLPDEDQSPTHCALSESRL